MKHSPGRLVVTNAVIVPSSSESDHSTKARNRRSQWINPQSTPTVLPPDISARAPSQQSSPYPRDPPAIPRGHRGTTVGLGLDVKGMSFRTGEKDTVPPDDDQSVYDDELSDSSLLAEEPLLAPDDGDDENFYEDEPSPALTHGPCFNRSDDLERERRREEALIGLVDGLHRDYRRTSGAGHRSSVARSEATDFNMQGVAISDSRDFENDDVTRARSPSQYPGSRVSQASRYSPASQWDQESTYSDGDFQDEHRVPNSQYDNRPKQHRSPQPRKDFHAAGATDRPASSLRQSRVTWKRPSTSLGIRDTHREDPRGEGQLFPVTSELDSPRRRSVSPVSAPVSPRSGSPLHTRGPSRSASPLPDTSSTATSSRPRKNDYNGSSGIKKPQRSRAKSLSSRSERPVETQASQGESLTARVRSSRGDRGPPGALALTPGQPEDPGARERLAFGIPESLSYPGNALTPDEQDSIRPPLSRLGSAESTRRTLPRADSDLSVADSAWEEQRISKEFSRGAAALIETLTSSAVKIRSARQDANRGPPYDYEQEKTPQAEPASWAPLETKPSSRPRSRSQSHSQARSRSRSRSPLPPPSNGPSSYGCARRRSVDSASLESCSSAESVYEAPADIARSPAVQHATTLPPADVRAPPPNAWRYTLPRDVYRSLSKQYGTMEMERQEVIYNFFQTEKTFVQSARHVIRTFFLPLRARDSRTWLPGLPADVARLFDWLEDIVNLHVAVVRALAGVVAVWKTGGIVSRVGGTLRAFVPQLEIYMPYLVKLESVRETLRWHAEKDRGELGEYLRMRERDRVEGEWTLDRLLEEPVARIAKYIEVYQVRLSLRV